MFRRRDISETTPREGSWTLPWQFPVSERRLLLMLGDIAATSASVLTGLMLWARVDHRPFTMHFVAQEAYWFLILPGLWLILASANDYYNLQVAARRGSSLLRLLVVTSQMLILYLAVFFLSPRNALPRLFVLYYAVIALALTGLWRACRLFLIGWTGFRRRSVIVGSGRSADLIWHAIKEEANADYEILGLVPSQYDPPEHMHPQAVLGTGSQLPDIVRRHAAAELIIAYLHEVPQDIFDGVMACYEQGAQVVQMTALYEQITGRIPIEHVNEHLWALVLPVEGRTLAFNVYLAVKRLIDILASVIGLLLFSFICPFLALAIRLDTPGPMFYVQSRLGQAGRPFNVLKLRSMVVDAEHDSGPMWASRGDQRITRVGRFLRKTRLDEVPQLLNVLRGEMSLVGPRPERPEMVAMLAQSIPFYRARLAVKPGLTGWAQVRYPYGSTVQDALSKLQYDLYYVRHQSLLLDLTILVRTIGVTLTFQGL